MSRLISLSRGGRSELPTAPPEVAEAVELFARKSGRTARLHFVPFGGWMVRFSLRSNDPRMKLWKEGRAPEPPTEDVWLHQPNPRYGEFIPGTMDREPRYRPLSLHDLGAAGVVEFLERGDTWSGRGEHDSVVSALKATREANEAGRVKNRADAKDESRQQWKDRRRSTLKIPFLGVGIDLKGKNGS